MKSLLVYFRLCNGTTMILTKSEFTNQTTHQVKKIHTRLAMLLEHVILWIFQTDAENILKFKILVFLCYKFGENGGWQPCLKVSTSSPNLRVWFEKTNYKFVQNELVKLYPSWLLFVWLCLGLVITFPLERSFLGTF